MKLQLYALTLPQPARLPVCAYHTSLLASYQWVSGLSLPPLIPLGWHASEGQQITIGQLPRIPSPPISIDTLQSPVRYRDCWYLPLADSTYTAALQGLLLDEDISDEGLFPPFDGIFLTAEGHDTPGQLSPFREPLHIRDVHLIRAEITTGQRDLWWEDTFVTISEDVHLH